MEVTGTCQQDLILYVAYVSDLFASTLEKCTRFNGQTFDETGKFISMSILDFTEDIRSKSNLLTVS